MSISNQILKQNYVFERYTFHNDCNYVEIKKTLEIAKHFIIFESNISQECQLDVQPYRLDNVQ